MQSRPLWFAIFLRAEPLHPTTRHERLTWSMVSRTVAALGASVSPRGIGPKGLVTQRSTAGNYKVPRKDARRRLYTTRILLQWPVRMMPSSHIVVHYHELWLKRGNR